MILKLLFVYVIIGLLFGIILALGLILAEQKGLKITLKLSIIYATHIIFAWPKYLMIIFKDGIQYKPIDELQKLVDEDEGS